MSNLVTVIIPVYNGEKTLSKCLESLAVQAYANYEVIVVDNASTDKTKEIIYSFKNKDEKFKYIFETQSSTGRARNTGIKNAQGNILFFTDADCVVPENWIEVLVRVIEHGDKAVTGGSKDLVKNYWSKNIQKFDDDFLARLDKNGYIGHVDTKNFAITAELMKGLMFEDKFGYMEDFEFYLRLKAKKVPIRFLSQVIVGHHHSSSFMKVVKSNFLRGFWVAKIYKNYDQNLENKELMFTSISVINFLSAPLWYVVKLVSNPLTFPYIISSDLAWRAGIIWAQIKMNKLTL